MTHLYKGWTIAPNGAEWCYRKNRWDIWQPAGTVAEAKACIDLLESES